MVRKMKNSGIEWFPIIPYSWKLGRIKNIIDILTDYTANGSFGDLAKNVQYLDYEDYARLVRLTDLREKLENEGIYVSQDSYEYLSKSKLFGGEVLVANVGAYAGLFCEMPEIDKRATLGPNMFLIRTNQNMLQHYLLYLGNSKIVGEQLIQKVVSAAQPKLNKNDLKTVVIPIPCIEEQKKIADYLDKKCAEIDSLSSDIQSQISILEDYKKSVIIEAVTKGLNPDVKMKDSGIEWIGEIPSDWKITHFKYVGTVKSNLVNVSLYQDYPQISPDNIAKDSGILLEYNTVEEAGVISDNHLFYKGQILYSKIRPKLNKAIIAPFDGLCSADMYPIETKECSKFVLYMILSQYFFKQVTLVTEDRVKMPKINQEELGKINVVWPTRKRQEDIAKYLDSKCSEINGAIEDKQKQLEVLEQYKKSLIYEYVTGKREVPDNND